MGLSIRAQDWQHWGPIKSGHAPLQEQAGGGGGGQASAIVRVSKIRSREEGSCGNPRGQLDGGFPVSSGEGEEVRP